MDNEREINADLNLGNIDFVTVKSNLIVKIEENLCLFASDGAHELRVKIIADLESVPEKYREVFLNMLTVKYINKVNFTSNPFSACLEKKKKNFLVRWIDKVFPI